MNLTSDPSLLGYIYKSFIPHCRMTLRVPMGKTAIFPTSDPKWAPGSPNVWPLVGPGEPRTDGFALPRHSKVWRSDTVEKKQTADILYYSCIILSIYWFLFVQSIKCYQQECKAIIYIHMLNKKLSHEINFSLCVHLCSVSFCDNSIVLCLGTITW